MGDSGQKKRQRMLLQQIQIRNVRMQNPVQADSTGYIVRVGEMAPDF